MPTTACPTLVGTIASIGIDHLGLDVANGWLYVHDTGDSIKRYTYPGLVFDSTIISDASVSGVTCDSSGNLYYVLNDGTGGDTEVYKRTPAGSTSSLTTFGSDAAFGITWHPVDEMLYVSIQRFSGGNVSAITQVNPTTGADAMVDGTVFPPFVSASGAAQAMPDGSLWFIGSTTLYHLNVSTGTRVSATDAALNGNLTVIPTPSSTALLNRDGGDREYGPDTPATFSSYACSVAADVLGAAHNSTWGTVVFTDGFNIYSLSSRRRWWVGTTGFSA